jgi:hypothetical protein
MTHQLAQINVARCRSPLDSPVMRDFVELLDAVNALADATPGFVWRLKSEKGNATDIRAFPDPLIIVNMSVWEGVGALQEYVYRSSHAHVLRRRRDWFEELDGPGLALWWIPGGHVPSVEEGKARLETLGRNGPSPEAFTFRQPFPPPQ